MVRFFFWYHDQSHKTKKHDDTKTMKGKEELAKTTTDLEVGHEQAPSVDREKQTTGIRWRRIGVITGLIVLVAAVILIPVGILVIKDDKPVEAQPVIFDTDYGPFIDDGKIISVSFLLDLKFVVATSEDPLLSAKCVAKHLDLAGRSDIPVGAGASFPPYEQRGGVCAVPGLVGFALESVCSDVDLPIHENGIEAMVKMIMESGRDDWWYIVVGEQSTVKTLVKSYPEAANKIDTLIIMGGDWCAGYEPYPDVLAPVDETNIACDPAAANDILDASISPFNHIYYVPVVMADEIGGADYMKIVEAAESEANVGAAAMLDFYRAWSEPGRADPSLLIHLEAMEYDPETESVPQFDPCAVMLALELLATEDCEDRVELFKFHAVHFYEAVCPILENHVRPFHSMLEKKLLTFRNNALLSLHSHLTQRILPRKSFLSWLLLATSLPKPKTASTLIWQLA